MNTQSLIKLNIKIIMFLCCLISSALAAPIPHINFIDIDSGPSSGLGDGLGSGAIVTLWGHNLGKTQGDSMVRFQPLGGTPIDVAHTYYWKNADGVLPSGPADLYTSHKMQEVAFSIPVIPNGNGRIFVTVNKVVSNGLSFTVRDGNIKWVSPEGDNRNDCSFNSPCGWINGDINGSTNGLGNQKLKAGDIVYSRGVNEPEYCGGGVCVGLFLRLAVGTADQPISLISYPNTRATVKSKHRGANLYLSEYVNISKFHISVGSMDPESAPNPGNPAASNFHIQTNKGRYVGNFLDEISGRCFNGWSGSIMSGGNGADNVKIFGNHFFDLGCDNTSRFQHTLYMSLRNSEAVAKAWEIAWNHLEDNKSLYGIHNYDETYTGDCGSLSGTISIHNNYIINQKGAGINVTSRDAYGEINTCWDADISIRNNTLINVGLGPSADDNVTNPGAIRIGGHLGSASVEIINNTIYRFSDPSSRLFDNAKAIFVSFSLASPQLTIKNNMIYADGDYFFLETNVIDTDISHNLFFTTASEPKRAIVPPDGINNLTADPLCTLVGNSLECSPDSVLRDAGTNTKSTSRGIFGSLRGDSPDIGSIEFSWASPPPLPPTLQVN